MSTFLHSSFVDSCTYGENENDDDDNHDDDDDDDNDDDDKNLLNSVTSPPCDSDATSLWDD